MAEAGPAVRPFRADDAETAAALEVLSSPSPWTPAQFREETAKPASRGWAADGPGGLEGFIVMWRVADEAQLANLAVHPSARRRGLGRALLRRAMQEAKASGARVFRLEVREGNAAARALYESEGLRETGRRPGFYEGRETALLMEKWL